MPAVISDTFAIDLVETVASGATKTITNPVLLKKLFEEVAPKFMGVNGGYTRVVKAGHRVGDTADVAYIQLTK
jgi:large subunit ribosomal protein L17